VASYIVRAQQDFDCCREVLKKSREIGIAFVIGYKNRKLTRIRETQLNTCKTSRLTLD